MLKLPNVTIKKNEAFKSNIPKDIHFLTFTSKEFKSMLTTTKFNVGKEAFKNNIILSGIENYYELIKND